MKIVWNPVWNHKSPSLDQAICCWPNILFSSYSLLSIIQSNLRLVWAKCQILKKFQSKCSFFHSSLGQDLFANSPTSLCSTLIRLYIHEVIHMKVIKKKKARYKRYFCCEVCLLLTWSINKRYPWLILCWLVKKVTFETQPFV